MKKILALSLSLVLFIFPAYAADNAVTLTAGSGVTMRTKDIGAGVQSPFNILGDATGTAIYGTAGSANSNVLSVQGIASGTAMPISGTLTAVTSITNAVTVAQPTAANLNATIVGTGTLAVQAAQSGTWNITNISGTISLPTGAATSALQTTINTTLGTPFQAGGSIGNTTFAATQATSSNLKAQVDPLTAASWGIGTSTQNSASATNGQLALGQFNTTPTTITTGNMSPLQMDNAGNLLVNIKTGASSGAVAQGSTTSGQTGLLIQGAVTTASPSYTTAQTSPLSLDLTGALRVNVTAGGAGGGIVTQATATNLNAAVVGTGTAGSPAGNILTIQGVASMTKLLVTPDSVALPANQSVNISQINAVTPLMGNGVTGTGSQRVTIASDNTAFTVNAQSATSPVVTMNSASANAGINAANAAVFDDVAPTSITENSFGFLRMSANRNAYNTIRDAAGNERGVNVDASNRLTSAPTLVSGSVNSGAYASGAFASGSIASGAIAAGAQVDLLTMRGTVAAGTAAANSLLTGAVFNTSAPTLTNGQQAALQSDINGNLKVTAATLDPCQSVAKISLPISQATSTQIITGTSSKKTYVCSMVIVPGDAENLSLVAGTGTVCATGIAAVIGATTAANGMNLAANGGFSAGNGMAFVAAGVTNTDNICLLQSGTGRVSGVLTYVQN